MDHNLLAIGLNLKVKSISENKSLSSVIASNFQVWVSLTHTPVPTPGADMAAIGTHADVWGKSDVFGTAKRLGGDLGGSRIEEGPGGGAGNRLDL